MICTCTKFFRIFESSKWYPVGTAISDFVQYCGVTAVLVLERGLFRYITGTISKFGSALRNPRSRSSRRSASSNQNQNMLLLQLAAAATQAGLQHDPGLVRHLREGKFFVMRFPIGVLHTWCLLAPLPVLTCLACQQQQICRWDDAMDLLIGRSHTPVQSLFW